MEFPKLFEFCWKMKQVTLKDGREFQELLTCPPSRNNLNLQAGITKFRLAFTKSRMTPDGQIFLILRLHEKAWRFPPADSSIGKSCRPASGRSGWKDEIHRLCDSADRQALTFILRHLWQRVRPDTSSFNPHNSPAGIHGTFLDHEDSSDCLMTERLFEESGEWTSFLYVWIPGKIQSFIQLHLSSLYSFSSGRIWSSVPFSFENQKRLAESFQLIWPQEQGQGICLVMSIPTQPHNFCRGKSREEGNRMPQSRTKKCKGGLFMKWKHKFWKKQKERSLKGKSEQFIYYEINRNYLAEE